MRDPSLSPEIERFMRAVYGDSYHLALASFNETKALNMAAEKIETLEKVAYAAARSVQNPAWAGMCDEDVALEAALREAGLLVAREDKS